MDLNKYNKRLLAFLGTLASLGLLLILTIFLIEIISDMSRRNRYVQQERGIVTDQNLVTDTTAYSFKQEISIHEPYQLDSLQPVFLIPIGQKDKKTKRIEYINAGIGFSNSSFSKDYYYSSFSGLYNNFVFVDYTKEVRIPVFNSKIALTDWAYMKINDKKLVLFKGTDSDTNKDGRLNDDDFQSLYVFDIQKQEIKELSFKNQTVLNFEPLKMTSKIYVRTGKDINNDKTFNYSKEPSDLYLYDVESGESEAMVPEELKIKIQEILSK